MYGIEVQKNWKIYKVELILIFWSLQYFTNYILQNRININFWSLQYYTNHISLLQI